MKTLLDAGFFFLWEDINLMEIKGESQVLDLIFTLDLELV